TVVAGICQSYGFTPDGELATASLLLYPYAVAVDRSGTLYIADSANNRIRRVDAEGRLQTIAGNGATTWSGDGGNALEAGMENPVAIALDASNNLFIVEQRSDRVRRVDAITGIITTVAGNGELGSLGDGQLATAAQLELPSGAVVDTAGNLYIVTSAKL